MPAHPAPPWLEELRRFRARVLYDHGRRPCFRTTGGYADPDPADTDAHHVLARHHGEIVAAFRMLPLHSPTGMCRRLLGHRRHDHLPATLGRPPAALWEGGGWAVEHQYRNTGLGMRALAGGIAVAEHHNLAVLIGAAGIHYGQYDTLTRAGLRPVPGLPPIPAPELADELRLVYSVTAAAPLPLRALVTEAATTLGLPRRT